MSKQPYFYTFDQYLKECFHEKVYKISLNGGMTCPNRDGTLGTKGCIFCSEGGSGDFASSPDLSISEQIQEGKKLLQNKTDCKKFIAYFQAFTNTYAPCDYLEKIFKEAISFEEIVALSIGTRPDCISDKTLGLLKKLNEQKPVIIELGLQTIHEQTAAFIRRGYPLSTFQDCVTRLANADIEIVVHLILGLPGETQEMMLDTIQYINTLPIKGIKLSMLHILKGTDLARIYEEHPFFTFDLENYTDLVLLCIKHLRKDIVIHRLTGDGPKDLLIAPRFSLNKRLVLNTIHQKCKLHQVYQGMELEI
ncbi:MAG: TIGR01212 family radical SAM protein [Lachnospiraceae bacterium]|nr:TIGR01212 family radical SAM protein [Lachnospiraceae bacterium]